MKLVQITCLSLPLVVAGAAGTAHAAQRTFVSGSGADGAPCTVVAPCRSFGRAITQTSTGGEIIVLDSAGYGAVTITKSVSIIAPAGIYAGISIASGVGVTINGANIAVTLRGLAINNIGTGSAGIAFQQGAKLVIEGCIISDVADNGIDLRAPNSFATVRETVVRAAFNSGLYVDALAGPIDVSIDRSHFERNHWGVFLRQGARAHANNSTFDYNLFGAMAVCDNPACQSATTLTVEASNFYRNSEGVSALSTIAPGVDASAATVQVARSAFSSNLDALTTQAQNGGVATVAISESTIGSNGLAASVNGGVVSIASSAITNSSNLAQIFGGGAVITYGNNVIRDNGPVIAGALTTATLQ